MGEMVFRSILLPQEVADELSRQSFALKCSTSDLVRYLLDQGLKSMATHVPRNEEVARWAVTRK